MATGDITDEYDERKSSRNCAKPICGMTLELVIPDGASTVEVVVDEIDHPCMNCLLVDCYLEFPELATAGKTVKLEILTERNNACFATAELDASSAGAAEYHWSDLQRGLKDKTAIKMTADAIVTGAKTFYVELRGV